MSNETARTENRAAKKTNLLDYLFQLKSMINVEQDKRDDYLENIRKAQSEWEKAQMYFQSVTEPDLIDHAIYNMEAARTKYFYLLKKARSNKINLDA